MFCFSFDSAESAVNCRELIEVVEVVQAKSIVGVFELDNPTRLLLGLSTFSVVVFPTRLLNCRIQKSVAMSDGTLRVIHSEPGDTELRVTHKLEAKFGHFLIGRHRKADLEIDNNIISRKHVVIK